MTSGSLKHLDLFRIGLLCLKNMKTSEQRTEQSKRQNSISKTGDQFERMFSKLMKSEPEGLKENKEKKPEMRKPVRYKPIPVEQMAEETQYSPTEVKSRYRAFKQECPTRICSEETFKEIYQKLFPLGDSSKYARLVLRSINTDRTG